MPIPQNVIDDAGYPIREEIRPALAEAVALKLDAAVFAGDEKPASWPEAIVPGAIAAGNTVTASREKVSICGPFRVRHRPLREPSGFA